MKKIYKGILKCLENFPVKIDKFKTKTFEKIAIRRKRKLYKDIKWSKEQKKEFNQYWKINYGKKISNKWHRLYEASNGVHCVEYFPEILYASNLEYKLNDYKSASVLSNKSFCPVLFDERIDGVRTPKTYVFKNNGQFFDPNRKPISESQAIDLIKDIGYAVIKPTIDSSSGRNIKIINIHNGQDTKTRSNIKSILCQYDKNFIVQEKLVQHEQLSALYSNSVNTVRIITYTCNNDIHTCPVSLRIGGNGSEVDNIHAGGMSIAISDDGYLSKYAYRLGYGDSFEKFAIHPNSKIKFENYKLDFIPKMISVAKELHAFTTNIGIISWDFTADSNGNIVVIEVNLKGQSSWFPQMLSGKSLFGENTASMLRYLNKRKR